MPHSILALLLALLAAIVLTSSTVLRGQALAYALIAPVLLGWVAVHGIPFAALLMLVPLGLTPKNEWEHKPSGHSRFLVLSLCLSATCLVVLLWSPNVSEGVLNAGGWLGLAAAISLGRRALDRPNQVRVIAKFLLVPVVMLAVTVVAFRLSPTLEYRYYSSRASGLFLGSAGHKLYTGNLLTENNATDPTRAAGFMFVSVNRASMMLGVSALVLWGLSRAYRLPMLRLGALAAAVAIPFTGSKTGVALLISVSAIMLATRFISGQKDAVVRGIATVAVLSGIGYAIRVILASSDDFVIQSQNTLEPRKYLWAEAARAIHENLTMGLGFGGWDARWLQGDVHVPFAAAIRPAHNWFLQAWLDGGIVYVLLNLAFALGVLAVVLREYKNALNGGGVTRLIFSLAPAWVVMHGLGDNTTLYGEFATIPLLGLAFAFLSVPTAPSGAATKSARVLGRVPARRTRALTRARR